MSTSLVWRLFEGRSLNGSMMLVTDYMLVKEPSSVSSWYVHTL